MEIIWWLSLNVSGLVTSDRCYENKTLALLLLLIYRITYNKEPQPPASVSPTVRENTCPTFLSIRLRIKCWNQANKHVGGKVQKSYFGLHVHAYTYS